MQRHHRLGEASIDQLRKIVERFGDRVVRSGRARHDSARAVRIFHSVLVAGVPDTNANAGEIGAAQMLGDITQPVVGRRAHHPA